jgi:lysophospholipase L1-like esterase
MLLLSPNRSARTVHAALVWLSLLSFGPLVHGSDPPLRLQLNNGDRVVLIGDTFIERDQRYGYLETAITLSHPDKNITFRNLGWSGDTVRGLSRAGFDPPEAGFRELAKQLTAARPSVVIVGYGMADSFDGKEGLPRFTKGLEALLDLISTTKARVVLLSPIAHEDLGGPLPDPSSHNRDLGLYRDAIREAARRRGAGFVDLFDFFEYQMTHPPTIRTGGVPPYTDDGIHLTRDGYAAAAFVITQGLDLGRAWEVRGAMLQWGGKLVGSDHSRVTDIQCQRNRLNLIMSDEFLPPPPSFLNGSVSFAPRKLQLQGLEPGRYTVKIDGQEVTRFDADDRGTASVALKTGPEWSQADLLRKTINEKNRLFFHRWRPENITYLFGFRSHEQGNNAIEVPRFDPLVEAKEREIARLRKPVPHAYEFIRVGEVAK